MKRTALRNARMEQGLSQEAMAKKVGLAHTVIYGIESKGTFPRASNIPKLALAYGMTTKEFVTILYE